MDRKKLALIHIIKRELGLSEAKYRQILKEAAGVESAKELNDEKFRALMRFFVRSKYYRINPSGLTIKQKLYIDYLARQAGWSSEHVNNFIHKYFHKEGVLSLGRGEAAKVIEALKNISRQKG